jgi:hypothetical protein
MAKEVVTGVNKVGNNFYRTKVVDNGDSTFSSTLLRTDAQGNNGVPIAGYGAVGNQLATEINTTNATVDEQRLLADPSSQLNQVRREQVRSTESQFFGTAATPTQKSALDQVGGGSGNTSTTTGSTDQQGGSTPTSNQNQTQSTSGDGVLIYPLNMAKTQQDRLKFIAVEYQPPGNLATGTLGSQNRTSTQGKKIIGSVFLPIQASISDFNSVEWQGASINEIQKQAVNASLGAMNAKGTADLSAEMQTQYNEALKKISGAQKEIKVAFAGEAVAIQNLLGRFGSVLNPNLELLFTGPQLRPFEFKFQMSAREKKEGENIKKIINFFKKNMAAKKDDKELFLRAPNTFLIEYKYNGSSETHPGINLIKECALLSCSVEYTPLGTYMTYPDGTMVSYTMSLSFQELEPVYDKDYSGHPIGY